jgi:hypothetical protein
VILGARHQWRTGKEIPPVSGYRRKVDLKGRTPTGHGPDPGSWRGFADDLIRQIREGVLEPGDEVAITWQAEEWKCARGTATKAFDHLVHLGLLLRPADNNRPYRVSGDDSWMCLNG